MDGITHWFVNWLSPLSAVPESFWSGLKLKNSIFGHVGGNWCKKWLKQWCRFFGASLLVSFFLGLHKLSVVEIHTVHSQAPPTSTAAEWLVHGEKLSEEFVHCSAAVEQPGFTEIHLKWKQLACKSVNSLIDMRNRDSQVCHISVVVFEQLTNTIIFHAGNIFDLYK